MTRYSGSRQEKDLTLGTNCHGFGRIHHFRQIQDPTWIPNPLPIVPASSYLNIPPQKLLLAQVFQLAVCNWRCWYCFVDFDLLSANKKFSDYVTPNTLLKRMLEESPNTQVIDLSGGQPDIVPEYALWFLKAREELGLNSSHYIWLDDNLSTDYIWRFLSEEDIGYMLNAPGFSRVGCLKGIDEESFAFNTAAEGSLLERQIELLARLVHAGFDQYGYITLTTPSRYQLREKIARLLDKIQLHVHRNFPLRTIPLRVFLFNANAGRFSTPAAENQFYALEAWQAEMQNRFTAAELAMPITEVSIGGK